MPTRLVLFAILLLNLSPLSRLAQSAAPPPFDSSGAARSAEEAKAAQQAWGKFLKRKVVGTNGVGMKLALIPPGSFVMGSPPEEERGLLSDPGPEAEHVVTISKPFYFGVHEVTQAEFKKVMGKEAGGANNGMDSSKWPVTFVTFDDVEEFCQKLSKKEKRSYRLPTEAEWEYACRAGSRTPFWCGDSIDGDQINCAAEEPYGKGKPGGYLQRPCDVGSFAPNPFGLYDVHGNVAEYCSDWFDKGYYAESPAQDPTGPAEANKSRRHSVRGGGFNGGVEVQRSAARWSQEGANEQIGFRVVMDLPDSVLALVPAPAGAPQSDEPTASATADAGAESELEGTWDVVGLIADGDEIPADEVKGSQVVIHGGTMTLTAFFGKMEFTFTTDPTQQPKHIDVSEAKKKPGPGIYELDGDSLKLSFSETEPRPEDYLARKKPKTTVFVLKRAKD